MRQRIHSARRQRRAKRCQFNSIDERGALTGIHVTGFHCITIEISGGVQQPGNGPVMEVGCLFRLVDFIRERYLLTSQLLLDM